MINMPEFMPKENGKKISLAFSVETTVFPLPPALKKL
jgi:hypothetical protein